MYAHLQQYDYKPFKSDPCIYHKAVTGGRILILSTVDDFLITAPTDAAIAKFKQTLARKYRITDLGVPTTFPGWTIQSAAQGPIHISQPALITKA